MTTRKFWIILGIASLFGSILLAYLFPTTLWWILGAIGTLIGITGHNVHSMKLDREEAEKRIELEVKAKEARDRAVIYTKKADEDAEKIKTQDEILKDLKAKREQLRAIYEKDKAARDAQNIPDGTGGTIASIRERLRKSGR